MRVTLAQLNPLVGDIDGNIDRMAAVLPQAERDHSHLVVFPELCLCGYPPMDLLDREWFLKEVEKGLERILHISARYPGTGLVAGLPRPNRSDRGKALHNAALLIRNGKILAERAKTLLPTYDVFDETRYFAPGNHTASVPFNSERMGLTICEDLWNDPDLRQKRQPYERNPVSELADDGATMMINLSASPFAMGKSVTRHRLVETCARRHGIPFVYLNQVGANDELIFDGGSFVLDRRGRVLTQLPSFEEAVVTVDLDGEGAEGASVPPDDVTGARRALVLGIGDYLGKCGFQRAVIGLSGGIDSALTCALAAEALGAENVLGISMPSPYSSEGSVEDSRRLARNLGVEFRVIPISRMFEAGLETLDAHLGSGPRRGLAEENLQARLRGNILMAFSNATGAMVLSTGNKSEMAMGYCTLYGDMSGGLAVLADVPKTLVYRISKSYNDTTEIIPGAIIDKEPSAELRPDQKDSDSLPPYDVLDDILQRYIEQGQSPEEIMAAGHGETTVRDVIRRVARNEYKRRQAPPGLKVTPKAFGVGRRMPIAANYLS